MPKHGARPRGPGRRCQAGPDHRDVLGAAFRQPDLARSTEDLAHVRGLARKAEALELLGRRVEAQHRVGAEVADPDLVALVDIDRVGARVSPGSFRVRQVFSRRVVDRQVAAVPFADPDVPVAVAPDAARALAARSAARRSSTRRAAVDAGDERAGQRAPPDIAVGVVQMPYGPRPRGASLTLTSPLFTATVPTTPLWPVNHRSPSSSKVAVFRFAYGVPAGSRKTRTSRSGQPTRTIAPWPPSVIHAALSGPWITPCGDEPEPSGMSSVRPRLRVEPAEMAAALRGEPDAAVGRRRDVVDAGAARRAERPGLHRCGGMKRPGTAATAANPARPCNAARREIETIVALRRNREKPHSEPAPPSATGAPPSRGQTRVRPQHVATRRRSPRPRRRSALRGAGTCPSRSSTARRRRAGSSPRSAT